MGRQTSSATDGGQEEPWAKLISAWESLAASTRDETLLADLLALWDERAGILKHVHLLSVRELDIPDEWADLSAGERKGYLRAQQALDNGRSYVDYGRHQVEKAVELAEVLDDTLAKEAQRSKEEFRAYQDTIIEPMRRDIMTAKAKLQDLEQRKAGLPSDSEDSAQQRKLLDIDIEGARTTLAINEIGLESLGNSDYC